MKNFKLSGIAKGGFLFVKILVIIVILVLVGLFFLGYFRANDKTRTAEAISKINSTKITLADVMGENLPPKPDQKLNDSTIAGIDANKNTIRDDVELAIFEKYPNSAKIRAAMLQYAQALQLELTEVFNSETLVATVQKEELSYGCLINSKVKMDDSQEEMQNLIVNTDLRKKRMSDIFEYLTSHGYKEGPKCDIDLSSLSN